MTKERCVLITGSAQGLGAGVARRLAADGWIVAVNDVAVKAVHNLVDELKHEGLSAVAAVADATDEISVTRMVQLLEQDVGHIDAIVLNATGPQPDRSLAETDWCELADELDFFVKSPHIVSSAVLPIMREQKYGRIGHIDSEVATKLVFQRTNYITAKNAQIGLAKSWALEVASAGITVNTVAPGFIPVERHSEISNADIDSYRATVPMKRLGTIEDIAAVIAFLLSEDAAYITGQRIVVDGGRHLT